MGRHESVIAKFRMKLGAILALRHTLRLLAAWGFGWAATVLVLGALLGMDRQPLLWGAAGVIPIVVISIFLACRRVPAASAIRALLDDQSKCGGLVMAGAEADLGDWSDRVGPVRTPTTHWRSGRTIALLAVAASLVVASFLIPHRYIIGPTANRLEVDKEIDNIAAKIETLKEEQLIENDEAEAIEEKLEQIRREATGQDPAKTWEALDHLEASAAQTAAEAAEKAVQETGELARSEELAEALQSPNLGLSDAAMTEAMGALAKMASDAMKKDGHFNKNLPRSLKDSLMSGSLTPEQLARLAAALRGGKIGNYSMMSRMVDAELIDANFLSACKMASTCDPNQLKLLLGKYCVGDGNMPCMSVAALLAGRGSIDRGRGDAPMTWAAESDKAGARFKEQVLPPSAMGLSDSSLIGVSLGEHEPGNATPSAGGALKDASAGGGSAHTHTILPRHKRSVSRYFDRKANRPSQ